MKVLYLSYDGLLDPLGQSQILPYVESLHSDEIQFDIVSFEKPYRWFKGNSPASLELRSRLEKRKIGWFPFGYTKSPPILSTLWDLWRLRQQVARLHREKKYDIIHCRSYPSSIVGLWAKRALGTAFVFDMRGFWADEKVDGKIWNPKRWPYSWVYRFFKHKERQFFSESDAIICLTHRAEKIIQSWNLKPQSLPITVIPCCVDANFFDRRNVNSSEVAKWREKLRIKDRDFVVLYLGSLIWYHLDEMLEFFAILKQRIPEAVLLFVTNDPPENFEEIARQHGVDPDHVRFTFSTRPQIPNLISIANIGLFFGQTSFSRTASSATKMAEFLSMGVPVVTNAGVGDTDEILSRQPVGLLIPEMKSKEYEIAADRLSDFLAKLTPEQIRRAAEAEFSLPMGVARYRKTYESIMDSRA